MEFNQSILINQKEYKVIVVGFVMDIKKLIFNGFLEYLENPIKNLSISICNMKDMNQDIWEK